MRIIFFLFIAFFFSNQSYATVALSVKNEEIPKTKILFFGFDSTDFRLSKDGSEILDRIRKNLKTTDLFEILKQSGPLEMSQKLPETQTASSANLSVESVPNFEKYAKAGIGAIVVAHMNYDAVGNLEMRVRLWDVLDQRQLFGKFYSASQDNYRKIANVVSNEIFKAISGESNGHFTSQIFYVSEVGPIAKRTKRVNIVDFDGENNRVLTDGRELVLTPVFARRRDEVFYVRYFQNKPQVYALNLKNLRSEKIGGFRGTTFSAFPNPLDPNLVLISAIIEGNSDIYELNISQNAAKRLTKSPAIDTTPAYSPDGKNIAFSSDRDAGQQIYIMDLNGDSVKRISFGGGTYSKPVWSPDGKLIAFTKIKGGQFSIGIISPSGKNEKIISTGYLVEGAKWSPNGRYLIFSEKKGPYGVSSIPKLYVVDIVTGFKFQIQTPEGEGATDPDWV